MSARSTENWVQPPLPFGQIEFVDPRSGDSMGYVDDFMAADDDETFATLLSKHLAIAEENEKTLTAKYGKPTLSDGRRVGETVPLSSINTHMGAQFQPDDEPAPVHPDQMHLPNFSGDELRELNKGWQPTPEQRSSHLASERALQSTPVSLEYLYQHNQETDHGQLPIEGLEWQWAHHRVEHDEDRMEQARRMFPVAPSADLNHQKRKKTIAMALYASSIPTHAFSALSAPIRVKNMDVSDGAAYPNSLLVNGKMLDINAQPYDGRPGQVIAHELGHVADYRSNKGKHVGVIGDRDNIFEPSGKQVYDHAVSAAGEGFADGIALRFQKGAKPPSGPDDPSHTEFYGYNPVWWSNPAHQASYVAHRAMAWSEGGRPHVSNEGELGTAEAVHIAGQNPHVRDAIRATGLTDTARNLSDQFMSTKRAGTQLSLLGDKYNQELYSISDVDWDAE